ncbi:MAG: hypothetical protein AAGJ18_20815 [Bacteroidota bacterium]
MSKQVKKETFALEWRGIKMTINYKENYFETTKGNGVHHLEVVTKNDQPIPITKTGYKSHFTYGDDVKQYETPVDFVKAWLEKKAKSKEWKAYEKKKNQLTLF